VKAYHKIAFGNLGRPPLPAALVDFDELEACFVVIDSAGQKLAYVYFAHWVKVKNPELLGQE
jgi:hypothetical protein